MAAGDKRSGSAPLPDSDETNKAPTQPESTDPHTAMVEAMAAAQRAVSQAQDAVTEAMEAAQKAVSQATGASNAPR